VTIVGSKPSNSLPELHAGFIPLTDCAPFVAAKELGYDRDEGFELVLHREVSWANMRDKLEAGLFDCAIMLAPLPLASTLGLGGRSAIPCVAVMSTSLNGNAITVSKSLYDAMLRHDEAATRAGSMSAAKAIKMIVSQRRAHDQEPLTLGIVYPFSCHNYDLRYWLAAAGIDPDRDVNLVVVPPPLMAGSLKAGRIDGFCSGEPWNSVAAAAGDGVIIATKRDLWNGSPEKVLAFRKSFLTAQPELVSKLVRALERACAWLDESYNRISAAKFLAESRYVGVNQGALKQALQDIIADDAIIFHHHDANLPLQSHAVWLLTQMIRCGQAHTPFDIGAIARAVYRPDVYLDAIGEAATGDTAHHAVSETIVFGNDRFNASTPLEYLKRMPLLSPSLDLSRFT
jgi:two-component system, oxyanion-binding sensor